MRAPGVVPRIEHRRVAADHYWPGQGRRKTKVVIHNTVGTDSAAWLSTSSVPPVSAHVLGRRDGSRLNLVDYADIAFHVGNARAGY
jgi:N-acetyl-anhydromuramyl-L-alanine amidase AmpD